MRVQVKYPGSQPHEVELPGRVSIVGRDPSCDLVVHDVKCSRRHAVLETGPDGVTVRDSGSANGVFVNGQRVERAVLRAGDTVSLGEVQIVLLPEPGSPAAEATLMAPSGGAVAPPPFPAPAAVTPVVAAPAARPAPPPPLPAAAPPPLPGLAGPPAAEPAPRARGSYSLSGSTESGKVSARDLAGDLDAAAAAARAADAQRPLTVTVLAVLWMASVVLYLATGIGGLVTAGGIAGVLSMALGGFLAVVSAAMAVGLWKVQPWARVAQIVIAALGVLTCSFTLPSVATLVYMLRAGVRARFATGQGPGDGHEGLFTGLILGTVLLGVLIATGGWALMSLGLGGSQLE